MKRDVQMQNDSNKNITLGVVAHVDAGKTTLSESILHLSGSIRNLGRVDHGDAFLDTFALEKQRGITIYSKQAIFNLAEKNFFLLDTPGHVDFTSEMERVLFVLDYCILLISAAESVTPKVQDFWRLLKHYNIPCFIFVNKMDQVEEDKTKILDDIHRLLSDTCIDFTGFENGFSNETLENIAVCDDNLLQAYLNGEKLETHDIIKLISERKLFPIFWGAALHGRGVAELLVALDYFTRVPNYNDEFSARVFKISRDENNARLTWMKINGGSLKNRMPLKYQKKSYGENLSRSGREDIATITDIEEFVEEKVDQIRIYSGAKYITVNEAKAGMVCAVTGLKETYIGQALGEENENINELLEPILRYQIILESTEDPFRVYRLLKELEEEDPLLRFSYQNRTNTLSVSIMGQVQMETLSDTIAKRFSIKVNFADPQVIYKETIKGRVFGVGHFEPLRHYSEVIVKVEAGELASGIVFENRVNSDKLKNSWQKLIMYYLKNKRHLGVLTGSELSDVKITLLSGRAHEKHTQSGDFKHAAIRAVRHALMQAESVLLEPVYAIELKLPQEYLGRAMTDLNFRGGKLESPEIVNNLALLKASIPARSLGDYTRELMAFSRGEAQISLNLAGYYPCENPEDIIEEIAYDPDMDLSNPSSSIFCANGAGFSVPWNEVKNHMHLQEDLRNLYLEEIAKDTKLGEYYSNNTSYKKSIIEIPNAQNSWKGSSKEAGISSKERQIRQVAEEKELQEIFEKTYGPIQKRDHEIFLARKAKGKVSQKNADKYNNLSSAEKLDIRTKLKEKQKVYLLVDGYNIIFASENMKALAQSNIKSARDALIDILINYQAYRDEIVILVFDAYKVQGGTEHIEQHGNILVIYTKQAETADQYIEKATHEKIKKGARVYVASSDALEQVIVFGHGALRISAREFWLKVEQIEAEIRKHLH